MGKRGPKPHDPKLGSRSERLMVAAPIGLRQYLEATAAEAGMTVSSRILKLTFMGIVTELGVLLDRGLSVLEVIERLDGLVSDPLIRGFLRAMLVFELAKRPDATAPKDAGDVPT